MRIVFLFQLIVLTVVVAVPQTNRNPGQIVEDTREKVNVTKILTEVPENFDYRQIKNKKGWPKFDGKKNILFNEPDMKKKNI